MCASPTVQPKEVLPGPKAMTQCDTLYRNKVGQTLSADPDTLVSAIRRSFAAAVPWAHALAKTPLCRTLQA